MALEERGRRITLKADTSQLQSEFKKVNATVRESERELRKLSTALKFNPNSLNALTQKQKELNRLIAQNYKQIGNLKKQLSNYTELGDTKNIRLVSNELEKVRARNEALKSSLRETNAVLKNFANITALAKLEKELSESRSNVERLNKALKLDENNISTVAHKFREMKLQAENLNKQVLILVQDLKKIDYNKDPQGFNKLNAKLKEVQAQAKHTEAELKKLGGVNFSYALAQIDKLDRELKKSRESSEKLNRELKFAPGNTALKDLRFSEARNELTKTREKVKLLKSELSKINVRDAREEFIKLNLKIAESERHIKTLLTSVGTLNAIKLSGLKNGLGSIGNTIVQNGDKLKNYGRNFTLGYTLPMLYGSKRALDVFRETDDTIRRVATAGTDGVASRFGEMYGRITESAREASVGSVYSMNQISLGMESLVKAGWNVSDSTKQVSHVMNLAKVDGLELERATQIVTDGMNAFGLKAKETERFVDVLNTTAIKSTTDVAELGEALKYVGGVAGNLGFTIEDVGAVMGIMANNGIKASIAGTSLRTGLTNLVKPSAQASKAMADVGFSAVDSEGKMKPLSQIVSELRDKTRGMTDAQRQQFTATVFGKTAMNGWMAVLKASDQQVKEFTDSINNSKGATKAMADQMTQGIGGAMDRFNSSIQRATYTLGKNLEPVLVSSLKGLTSLVDGFEKMPGGIQATIGSFAGLSVAIPPVTWAIGGMAKQYKAFFAFAKAHPLGMAIAGGLTVYPLIKGYINELAEKYDPLIKAQKKTKESADKLAQTFSKVGESATEYRNRLENTKGILEEIYGNDSYKSKLQEYAQSIQEAYKDINNTIDKAVAQNRELSNAEVANLSENISQIQTLLEKRTAEEKQAYDKITNLATNLNNFKQMSNEAYLRNHAKYVKETGDLHKQAIENAKQWYDNTIAINDKLPESMRRTTESIEAEYQARLKAENENYSKTMAILNQGYNERFKIEEKHIADLRTARQGLEEVERQYNARVKEIQENNRLTQLQQHALLKKEDTRFEREKQWHYDNLANMFDAHRIKELGTWLQNIQDTVNNGGKLTEAQAKNVQDFLATMDGLPEETRKQIVQGLKDAGIDVEDLSQKLKEQMNTTGQGIIEELASGISSGNPQVSTAMQGIIDGMSTMVGGFSLFSLAQSVIGTKADGLLAGKPNVDGSMDAITTGMQDKVKNTDMSPVGRDKASELARGINDNSNEVRNAGEHAGQEGRSGADSVEFSDVGLGMISGMINGASNNSGSLYTTLQNIALGALSAAKSILGIFSPSRVFKREVGHWIAPGIAEGVRGNANVFYGSITDTMRGGLQKAKNFNFADKLSNIVDFRTVADYNLQHNISQSNAVIDKLNEAIATFNDLELKSDVYLDGDKVGNATYKRHEVLDRRLGL
nr:MAG TPA: minor tail protein [Caudoviricetes sp.]